MPYRKRHLLNIIYLLYVFVMETNKEFIYLSIYFLRHGNFRDYVFKTCLDTIRNRKYYLAYLKNKRRK